LVVAGTAIASWGADTSNPAGLAERLGDLDGYRCHTEAAPAQFV
jgi:hypothetical protein